MMSYLWEILCVTSLTCLLLSVPASSLCHRDDRLALLDFKNSFRINPLASQDCSDHLFDLVSGGESNEVVNAKTKSWHKDIDCCKWDGVTCHQLSGRVIGLDLSCSQLKGTIRANSTLFQLRYLKTLNLAFNDFSLSSISPQFGNLSHLTHLNLSDSNFQGTISSEISHLQQLVLLDLSYNDLDMTYFKVIVDNLTALTHLSLDHVHIASNVPQSLVNLSSLLHLSLFGCSMQGTLPPNIMNLPHLQVLSVGNNPDLNINTKLFNLSSFLEILDFTNLNISNQIPHSLGQAKSLRRLGLHGCKLFGTIPPWVWNISESIELGDNHLTGSLPSRLSNLQSLIALGLSSNNLSGSVELNMFSQSKNLRVLDLSNSGLSIITTTTHELNSTLNWPQLYMLLLSSCNISAFPSLKDPKYLLWLDLSYNKIQGEIPTWVRQMGRLLDVNNEDITLYISHNSLTHGLEHLPWKKLSLVDLSSNMLQALPILPKNLIMNGLYASNNRLNGTFHPSICNMNNILVLDLSNNALVGGIPHCLSNVSISLQVLNLQSNRLNGTLHKKFSKCNFLDYLDLSNNQFEGVVPHSLSLCQSLKVLNLGNNKLSGPFPTWIEKLPRLEVLNLRCNGLQGPIINSFKVQHPFSKLQILDLSNNKFSGSLPVSYIRNFTAMMNMNESGIGSPQYMGSNYMGYIYSIVLTFNGRQQMYEKIITTLSTFDMSNNNFEGEIPNVIGGLHALRGLNLSHNLLNGHIPSSIGNLTLLDCLDLSSNKLTGPIPQELVSLTSLGVFNVSDNLLEGPIPNVNNFGTFGADSYRGNVGLCGQPLLECGGSHSPTSNNIGEDEDDSEDDASLLLEWEIILMGFSSGVVVGLAWGYYMLSVGKPFWFIKLAQRMELVLLDIGRMLFDRRGGRTRN